MEPTAVRHNDAGIVKTVGRNISIDEFFCTSEKTLRMHDENLGLSPIDTDRAERGGRVYDARRCSGERRLAGPVEVQEMRKRPNRFFTTGSQCGQLLPDCRPADKYGENEGVPSPRSTPRLDHPRIVPLNWRQNQFLPQRRAPAPLRGRAQPGGISVIPGDSRTSFEI